MTNKEFTHLSKSGVKMVEVGNKAVVKRTATAKGKIHLQRDTIELIRKEEIKKGNVITNSTDSSYKCCKINPSFNTSMPLTENNRCQRGF